MRLRARFRNRTLILTVAGALWLLVFLCGPLVGVNLPLEVFLIGNGVYLVASLALLVSTVRQMRDEARRVVAAHEGSAAFLTGVVSWPAIPREVTGRVIAVVADHTGLSFRDHEDQEVLVVPADRIMSLELAPLQLRRGVRPFRVMTIDGDTIEFTGPFNGDDLVNAIVALRTALGRSAG